jgi:hypothetical protein
LPCGFPRSLHRRQEQTHQHADDRDHDQQFDKRETGRASDATAGRTEGGRSTIDTADIT